MTVTKKEITDRLRDGMGLTAGESRQLVESLFNHIRKALAGGEDVLLSGFGRFHLREKRDRPGRNPRNGEPFTISRRRVVMFKASTLLKNEVMNREN
ncbi:integration host factor subunit alpha [Acidithiobacillus sp. MC6.1]|nr:integration host factor subunit alpha [Acidithiobacillus sp. MC6.1]